MAKKWNIYTKLRSAIREVWRFSPERRFALKMAMDDIDKKFLCSVCKQKFDKWCVDVDHVTPCGSFLSFDDAPGFLDRMFNGRLTILCKLCHKAKTKEERRKKK
jgi:hypothetical protein